MYLVYDNIIEVSVHLREVFRQPVQRAAQRFLLVRQIGCLGVNAIASDYVHTIELICQNGISAAGEAYPLAQSD